MDDAFPTHINPWTYNIGADTISLTICDDYAFRSNQAFDFSQSNYDSDVDSTSLMIGSEFNFIIYIVFKHDRFNFFRRFTYFR